MRKKYMTIISILLLSQGHTTHVKIIGGGIVGLLEAYTTYQDAQKENKECFISIYDKGLSFDIGQQGGPSTNTTYNLVPSLAPDEILGLVPCGSELTKKLAIPYYQSEGIRIDDVPGVNDSPSAIRFKDMTTSYENDPNHEDRSLALITLGKMSMDLWKKLYEEGDLEIQDILKSSNLNLCKELNDPSIKTLHDGYRIDLIYDTFEAKEKADSMIADYTEMGYLHCAILSPQEVMAIDPELTNFCQEHATLDDQGNFVWHTDAVALWRPGGCIDTRSFLPKMASYLKRKMGDSFHFYFNKEITQVFVENNKITHLQYKDGSLEKEEECTYIFCPGESVGTLERLGFQEPAYAAFAGSSLTLHIPLTKEEKEVHKNFSHCMEIIGDGIMLAWQARCKEDSLFIGVGGAKAFYGDKQPHINEDFAKNRNLLQLNKVNDILSHFLSLAFGYNTKGKSLTEEDLSFLENQGIAKRWVGRRAVAYDGFPTLGALYYKGSKISNARCTTHLGSGGVSFCLAAIEISRKYADSNLNPFYQKILRYADSRRPS